MTEGERPVVTPEALDRIERHFMAILSERDHRYKLVDEERERRSTLLDAERDQRYEQRYRDAERAVEAALLSAEKAVQKAEIATEKRFDSVNEFRNQMGDMQRLLMPRLEAEQRMGNLEKQIDSLEALISENRARLRGGKEMWAYIIGAVGLLLAVASFAMKAIP
jgi:small-conductance mechanosensitive channel